MKKIILAGGCFWGVERYYQRLKGVVDTEVGYTDGPTPNPSYRDVCNASGHVEAVVVHYDETILPLAKILEHFFRIVDPTQYNKQGHDIGVQYRNAVFFYDAADEAAIHQFLSEAQKNYKKKIHTYVKAATPFFNAEDYHQDYLVKNPSGYCHVNMHLAKPEELK
ncbi:MAG: peptide-methionine (S)-S-oxide reductase MsrA [Bacillus subtilis]|nr:peptide-methionine (S)-S-oxide reductase MsrA [Bacillus subtilis]